MPRADLFDVSGRCYTGRMPSPKHFASARRAFTAYLITLLVILGARILATFTLDYAAANGITDSGESLLVDALLYAAAAIGILSLIPLFYAVNATLDARREYDEGYTRLWLAVTTYDLRLATGQAKPQRPVVRDPKTYSEMVFGKAEDA